MIYEYCCDSCEHTFEVILKVHQRYVPTEEPCPECGNLRVYKLPSKSSFNVPEGACGNANNGYSSYHGDSENFKARAKNEPLPYPKGKG